MQSVRRSEPSPYNAGEAGIKTVSMSEPSSSRNKNFCVVSSEPTLRTGSNSSNPNAAPNASRKAAGRLDIASNDLALFT